MDSQEQEQQRFRTTATKKKPSGAQKLGSTFWVRLALSAFFLMAVVIGVLMLLSIELKRIG